ncbi:hypothetical protein DL93DRAFT_1235328 [Clavulina sp. PMI_390]|nr:hypothetical protein DL93DRAFT_1235328 [Clavulina sp. PMI_390]
MQTPQDNSDTRINPEGNDLDVEVADDDPPPFAGKRPLVRQSSSTSTNVRPVKKPKLSQKVPRRSLLDAAHLPASSATPDSISPSVPVSIPNLASKSSGSLASASTAMTSTTPHPSSTPNPTAPSLSLEERRRNRRRTELEETIQAALQERAAAVPPSEMNRVIGVPVRIDTPLPAGAPLDEKKKPLELLRGEIVLSPKHFSHVSPEQLQLLRRLDLPVVLGILQKEVKKAYIEELRAKKAKEAREAKAKAPLSATSIVRDASAPS